MRHKTQHWLPFWSWQLVASIILRLRSEKLLICDKWLSFELHCSRPLPHTLIKRTLVNQDNVDLGEKGADWNVVKCNKIWFMYTVKCALHVAHATVFVVSYAKDKSCLLLLKSGLLRSNEFKDVKTFSVVKKLKAFSLHENLVCRKISMQRELKLRKACVHFGQCRVLSLAVSVPLCKSHPTLC